MQPANPSHACALVLVDELARCGITDAVLAPGSRSAALAIVLEEEPRIRLHVELDERCAGFLAIGLGRATGRPAPVVVTSGSAVANLHPAVVEADTAAVPLLLFTADRPPELRATGANQTIDQLGIFARAPRWQVELGVPEDRATSNALWRSTVDRAVAAATGLTGSPGPVHVNVPFREPTAPVSDDGRAPPAVPFVAPTHGRAGNQPWVTVDRASRVAPATQLADLAARIAATERGLVVVGSTSDPHPGRTAGEIHAFARAAGWPVIAEPTSGARTDDDAIAHAASLLAHAGFVAASRPDLVLRIGRTGLSRELAQLLGPDVPQVLLSPDGVWDDPERSIAHLLAADVASSCAGLTAQLGGPAGSDWRDRWIAADRAVRRAIDVVLDPDGQPCEPRTLRDLAASVPDGTTLVVGSSMPVRDLDRVLAPRSGLRVVANRGASGIDGFVSTTLGVALARATAVGTDPVAGPVVGVCGDLTLLHDASGFHLSPALEHLDATFVVVDNDGGGIFSFLPQAGATASFERVFATPHGRDLATLAAFHGLGYQPVTRARDLGEACGAALEAGGLQLVHVRTERDANVAVHRELAAAIHAALDELLA